MIDTLTVLVVSGMVYLVMPVNTWLAVQSIRLPSTFYWCLGSFFLGISILLIGLRQEIDTFWSITGAQTLLLYSFLLRARGFQKDIHQVKNPHWFLVALTASNAVLIQFLLQAELLYSLDVWVRTQNTVLLVWFTGQIFQYARTLKSRNGMGMAFIYSLVSVAFVFNMVLTWLGMSSLFDNHINPGTLAVGLASILSAIFGHINYMGVVYEGSIREMALEATRKERAGNSQKMMSTLTDLDRQIRMGALSTSLSHAISQPLASMLLHLGQSQKWLSAPLQDREKATRSLNKVIDETQRAADTIEDIRQFLRPTKPSVELFEAQELIHNIKRLLHHEAINSGVVLSIPTPPSGVMLYGDKLQLTHALITLSQTMMSATIHARGLVIRFDYAQQKEKFIIKIIHEGVSLTEKDLKMPAMIVGQFEGDILAETPTSTTIQLSSPNLLGGVSSNKTV